MVSRSTKTFLSITPPLAAGAAAAGGSGMSPDSAAGRSIPNSCSSCLTEHQAVNKKAGDAFQLVEQDVSDFPPSHSAFPNFLSSQSHHRGCTYCSHMSTN